jgi:hypothetical protein
VTKVLGSCEFFEFSSLPLIIATCLGIRTQLPIAELSGGTEGADGGHGPPQHLFY